MGGIRRRSFLTGGTALGLGAMGSVAAGSKAQAAPAIPGTDLTTAAVKAPKVSKTNTSLNGQGGWFVPSDWGQSWRAALTSAKAGKGTAVAAVVGDSVSHGYWASDLFKTPWIEVLRKSLTTVGGYGGSGFQSQAYSYTVMYNPGSEVPAYYTSVANNVWTQSANWQGNANYYGPGSGSILSTAAGATASNVITGSTLGVWYYDSGAGFTVAIDGTTVGSVSVGSSGTPTLATYPTGSSGQHSWTITSAGSGTAICGVLGLNPTGARIDNFSFPGLFSSIPNNSDTYQSGTYMGGWRNPANLIVYELGGDDIVGADPNYTSGTPADQWAANIETYLEGVMDITYGGNSVGKVDVLFLFPLPFLAFDKYHLWNAYKARIIGIAQAYGAAVFDVGTQFHQSWNGWQSLGYAGNQSNPASNGLDATHPSDAGHALIGSELAKLLATTS